MHLFGFLIYLLGLILSSDYVTGFHKRKKKRRKEGQLQQQEAERRKRIEKRKQVSLLIFGFSTLLSF